MSSPFRLAPIVTFAAGLVRLRQRRAQLLNALAVPLALLWVVALLQSQLLAAGSSLPQDGVPQSNASLLPSLVLLLVAGALQVIFAVNAFRIVLAEQPPALPRAGLAWTRRETRFAASFIQISLLSVAPSIFLTSAFEPLGLNPDPEQWGLTEWGLLGLALLPGLWLFGRWAPIFPAQALEQPITPAASWQLTKHNGWRVLVSIHGPSIVLFLVTIGLGRVDSPVADGPLGVAVATLGSVLLHQGSTLLGIASLSIAYHQLQAVSLAAEATKAPPTS